MSWLDDIKLAYWGLNGAAPSQRTQGVNLVDRGITAVDNPNFVTTLPDGTAVNGRTELAIPAPGPNFVWYARAAPAVAADRWLSNYGAWQTSQNFCKCNTIEFQATALSFMCRGGMPPEDIVITLYRNLNPVAGWSMTLFGGSGPIYKAEIRPTTPLLVGNGNLVGIRATQAGATARPGWNASFILT
jgi:hypothetical protein